MKVTVCIPTIPPRGELLARALASVAAQTKPPAAISVAYDLDRRGAAHTRNMALFAASTEWVAFLDDDDVLYPTHLEQLCAHASLMGADVVWPWYDVIDGTDPFPMHEGRQYDRADPHIFPITALVRRDYAVKVGGFPLRTPVSEECAGEDFPFWMAVHDAGATFSHLPVRTWAWHHDTGNTSGLPRW